MKLFRRYKIGWVPEGSGWRKEGYIIMSPRKNLGENTFQLRKVKSPQKIQLSVRVGSFTTLSQAMIAGNKAIKKENDGTVIS